MAARSKPKRAKHRINKRIITRVKQGEHLPAIRDAQAMLAEMRHPGFVADVIQQRYKRASPTIDNIMREALTGLLERHGYTVSQLHATAQRALHEICISPHADDRMRLKASRKLRRHFVQPDNTADDVPGILYRTEDATDEELREELNRLRRELRQARRGENERAVIRVDFSRKLSRERRAAQRADQRRRMPKLLAEVKVLLAHPYQPDVIAEVLKKRHNLRLDSARLVIAEAMATMAQEAQLHPVQIELLAQQRAVEVIKDKESSNEDRLAAVDALIETTHMRMEDSRDDVTAMQLRARVLDMDELLPDEILTLENDLQMDARERWRWEL